MLFFINDHLITDETQSEGTWTKGQHPEEYKRCLIKTNGSQRRQDDGSFKKTERIICVHNCGVSPAAKTRVISTISEGDYQPRVSVRTAADVRYDTDAFVIAIPYNGLVLPIEHEDELMVYRFLIVKSDQATFEDEDGKYKRCIYLVATPKYAEQQANGWYSEKCNLVIKTIQSNKGRNDTDTSNAKWTVKTHTVRFGSDGLFEITVDTEEVPYDTINPDDLRNAKLCATVEPTKLKPRPENASTNNVGDAMKKAFSKKKQRG